MFSSYPVPGSSTKPRRPYWEAYLRLRVPYTSPSVGPPWKPCQPKTPSAGSLTPGPSPDLFFAQPPSSSPTPKR